MTPWFLNFDFKGRSRRSHWWANFGAWVGVGFAALVLLGTIAGLSEGNPRGAGGTLAGIFTLLTIPLFLVCIVDHMAMTFRRAHDTGKSGLIWILIWIPFINLIPFYFLMIEDSSEGANKYGPATKSFYAPEG